MHNIGMLKETSPCQRKQVTRDFRQIRAGTQSARWSCVTTSCSGGSGPSVVPHLHVFQSLLPAPHSLYLSNVSSSDCWHQVHGWCDKQGEDGFLWEAAVASLPRKHLLEVQWDGHGSGGSGHSGYLRLHITFSSMSCSLTRGLSFLPTPSL